MKMTPRKSIVAVVFIALALAGAFVWYNWEKKTPWQKAVSPDQSGALFYSRPQTDNPTAMTNLSRVLNFNPTAFLGFHQLASQMSDAEKAKVTNLFATKLKPAAEKWASVYGDRVPFNLGDLTMDKFFERTGPDSGLYHSYTFVMGDITLGIAEQNGETAVQYLASRSGLRATQTLPSTGVAPDLSMPVTREQVTALVQADCGEQFPPNLVQLIPSAESGSLAGGALVNVGSAVKNAAGIPISKSKRGFNYIFAKDGTLAYYMRTQ